MVFLENIRYCTPRVNRKHAPHFFRGAGGKSILPPNTGAQVLPGDVSHIAELADKGGNGALATLLRVPLGGRHCRIHGLGGRADLNGCTGVAVAYSAQRGRYALEIDGTGESVRVRPQNLHLSTDEEPAAAALEPEPATVGRRGQPDLAPAEAKKGQGARLFKLGEWGAAEQAYAEAVAAVPEAAAVWPAAESLLIALRANRAMCLLKAGGQAEAAVEQCAEGYVDCCRFSY